MIEIDEHSQLEVANIVNGVFAPLTGFMGEKDYRSVVDHMHLANGSPWTIPVTLAVSEEILPSIKRCGIASLVNHQGTPIASLEVSDVFKVHPQDLTKIYGTQDAKHPGVAMETARSPFRIGGKLTGNHWESDLFPRYALTPLQTKEIFKKMGWKTITGFQTRNPSHRAHEYLQRIALAITDGLLIQPLIGWKKAGDITPEAVLAAYEKMLTDFYPQTNVLLACLRTPMRYAGPREAIFHAIIRRNFGCTHFIVGRDHAGVGNFYGPYEAHDLCARFNDLGIQILTFRGLYYCQRCLTVVTEKTCNHGEQYALSVSGTELRAMIKRSQNPPPEFMRPEIADLLMQLHAQGRLFIGDSSI